MNHQSQQAILSSGQQVLALEANALEALKNGLGEAFTQAVLRIATLQTKPQTGRLIVTGIGKSGHIGAKMAATFASTGTPAQFVHAAEAAHGDLGMITADDLILALSNSGETSELAPLLDYARQNKIDIIAITAKQDSTLAKLATIALILPCMPEAASIGLAPTTSTTMTLALGDALAVALMEYHQFSPEQFKRFHPGGKLGQHLRQVKEVMHKGDEIPLCDEALLMDEAIIRISSHRFGCIGVTDQNNQLMGIVTDGDLRRHMQDKGFLTKPIAQIMTHTPKTLTPNTLIDEALNLMNENKITVFFVVDDTNRPLGIVHIHDLRRPNGT